MVFPDMSIRVARHGMEVTEPTDTTRPLSMTRVASSKVRPVPSMIRAPVSAITPAWGTCARAAEGNPEAAENRMAHTARKRTALGTSIDLDTQDSKLLWVQTGTRQSGR